MEQTTIALLAALSGWIFGLYGFMRNSKKDASEDAKTIGSILQTLDNIDEKITDFKKQIESSGADIRFILERLIISERDIKSAHKRIDEMKDVIKSLSNEREK